MIARRLASLLLALVLAGCSSIAALSQGPDAPRFACDEGWYVPRIYGGVFVDIAYIKAGSEDVGVVFWDLPFSLAVDTVTIPYTIVTQLAWGNLCPRPETGA